MCIIKAEPHTLNLPWRNWSDHMSSWACYKAWIILTPQTHSTLTHFELNIYPSLWWKQGKKRRFTMTVAALREFPPFSLPSQDPSGWCVWLWPRQWGRRRSSSPVNTLCCWSCLMVNTQTLLVPYYSPTRSVSWTPGAGQRAGRRLPAESNQGGGANAAGEDHGGLAGRSASCGYRMHGCGEQHSDRHLCTWCGEFALTFEAPPPELRISACPMRR